MGGEGGRGRPIGKGSEINIVSEIKCEMVACLYIGW